MLAVPDVHEVFQIEYFRTMTGKNPVEGENITVIFAKEETARDELTEESFYPIGITGRITEINHEGYLVAKMSTRVNLDDVFIYPDHTISLTISKREEIEDLDENYAKQRLDNLRSEIVRFSQDFQWGSMVRSYATIWRNMGDIASAFSPWMRNSAEEKYAVLAEDSQQERFNRMEKMVYENLELMKVQNSAKNAQEMDYQKVYRESAIRKQMEFLQKELDELHPENVSDIRKLEIKVEESEMNETARKEARKLLNRLKSENQHSAESGMLMDYLDFLTSLPWKKEEPKKIPLDQAEQVLEEDHFGLGKVKKRILQQIAVMSLKNQQSGSIILFVGAPGTGKTSIGQSIARALKREYVRVSLGGVRDEADIRGHRRTYIGSMPGRIMDGIHKCGVSNPVMVLDEVDKLSQSYNGDPASALLEVLDPEQNHTFTDHYLNVPYDLGDVLFICTANSLDTIPAPLLDRMEVIQFQGYTPLDKMQIAKRHLLPKAMKAVGLQPEQLAVSDEAIEQVISEYTREAGVRGLKKRMDMICRNAAVQLVREEATELSVTTENLKEYMDINPVRQKSVKESAKPGIITGLAWTQSGGDILYIETMLTRGSGKVQITGQLGDVMKESAQIAISLVKNLFPDKAELFADHDLHIHVPDGATPKDGPSAGITLTVALSSLISGISVTPKVAMTGEVSLQGSVNPIGGLPEKLMAAQRAGVKKVFIPETNVDDLKDVAQEVQDALEIIPVAEVEDVLANLGLIEKRAEQKVG
jgi:ATP-dependent Lon protease